MFSKLFIKYAVEHDLGIPSTSDVDPQNLVNADPDPGQ